MISRRYGARSVRHWPGSALLSALSFLCASAHWLTVSCGFGFHLDSRCSRNRGTVGGKFSDTLVNESSGCRNDCWCCSLVAVLPKALGNLLQPTLSPINVLPVEFGHLRNDAEFAATLRVLECGLICLLGREPRALPVQGKALSIDLEVPPDRSLQVALRLVPSALAALRDHRHAVAHPRAHRFHGHPEDFGEFLRALGDHWQKETDPRGCLELADNCAPMAPAACGLGRTRAI
jgi:hypothetical protein